MPEGEDPDDLLGREGPEGLAARIDEAPDFLTWLLEDVRPDAAGLSPAEKRERVAKVLETLAAIPDRILRYEEYRKVSQAVSVPLDVLWGADKANLSPGITRSKDVGDLHTAAGGTGGNAPALSPVSLPGAEKQLLQALMAGGELNSLILGTLNTDHLTDERVRKVVLALRKTSKGSEVVDFQRQIADLTEEERSFISGFALEEAEPTPKGVEELLKRLESSSIERESAEIQRAIDRAGEGSRDLAELMRRKQEIMRRKAALGRAPRWKGNELGD
jgi:DNA primase